MNSMMAMQTAKIFTRHRGGARKRAFLPAAWMAWAVAAVAAAGAKPGRDAQFASPPAEYRPHGWFFWVNGHITKEGLDKDLEAMREAGLGGGILFDVGQPGPVGPVGFFNEEWRGLMRHMLAEGARLGLQFGAHNCPGYSSSGGPWVPVEQSMKELGWTETFVEGPGRVPGPLPKPPVKMDFYQDVAVLAYPDSGNLLSRGQPSVKSGGQPLEAGPLADLDLEKDFPMAADGAVEVELAEAATVCAAAWGGAGAGAKPASVRLLAGEQAGNLREIGSFAFVGYSGRILKTVNFPPVTARVFRFEAEAGMRVAELGLFASPRVVDPTWKAHFASRMNATKEAPPPSGLPPIPDAAQVVDLTGKLRPDGTLDWEAPPGPWTVLRFGITTNGKGPHPSRAGKGLECDKLDAAAMRAHMESYIGQIAKDAGPLAGEAFRYCEIDSYEVGFQNWTARMPEKFRERRGYEIGPWLVALAGRPLNSLEETDRFLWDFRRTVADLFADEYYGTFQKFLGERGILAYAEAYHGHGHFVGDASQCSGRVDAPMCEFWWREPAGGKSPGNGTPDYVLGAHAANTYGRNIVAAEAFSTLASEAGWRNHPRAMKRQGDQMFLSGVNQFIFHAHPHQAYDAAPGITLGVWGSQFGRHVSWWPLARGWHDYLGRCQFLLRQGVSRSDVARHRGEEVTEEHHLPWLGLPAGVRTDNINTETILNAMSVRDGKLVLPYGAEYLFLVMESDVMRPELARKIEALVAAGGTVLGPKPVRAPGLRDWREAGAEVKKIGDAVWGECDGTNITEHVYGMGRVFWGKPPADVFKALGAQPDFESPNARLGFLHRAAPGFDAYFVVNSASERAVVGCLFRAAGRPPEMWDPMTGAITRPREFKETADGRTEVKIDLPADGSVFVVFREKGPAELPVELDSGALKAVREVAGPWEVRFQPGRGAPESATFEKLASWPEHPDAGIRYFSGVAAYRAKFEAPEAGGGRRLFLHLGAVADVARVRLNGADLGCVWAEPARVEITGAAKPGENTLEIEVANRWINRLIGDEQFPDDVDWQRRNDFGATGFAVTGLPAWFPDLARRSEPRRVGFPFFKHYTKETPLVPSGLLGPVTVEALP